MENQGWGFELDLEAMARDTGERRDGHSHAGAAAVHRQGVQPAATSPKANTSGTWFAKHDSSLDGDQTYMDGDVRSLPRLDKACEDYRGSWPERARPAQSVADVNGEVVDHHAHRKWSGEAADTVGKWSTLHQWYSSTSDATDSSLREREHADQRLMDTADSTWNTGADVRWSLSDPYPQPAPHMENKCGESDEEEPLDELTKYWATPTVYDIIRPKSRRPHGPFADTPTPPRYEGDSWGSEPKPVMTYNGEVYTSDVLIEQSKREFWGKRNGEWVLLNQSTDTRISHQQPQPQPQPQPEPQPQPQHQHQQQDQHRQEHHQEHQLQHKEQQDPDNILDSPSATCTETRNMFSLGSVDFDKRGFVDEDIWRKPRMASSTRDGQVAGVPEMDRDHGRDARRISIGYFEGGAATSNASEDDWREPARSPRDHSAEGSLAHDATDDACEKSGPGSIEYSTQEVSAPSDTQDEPKEAEEELVSYSRNDVSAPTSSAVVDSLLGLDFRETTTADAAPFEVGMEVKISDEPHTDHLSVCDVGMLVDLDTSLSPTSSEEMSPVFSPAIPPAIPSKTLSAPLSTHQESLLDLDMDLGSPHDWLNQIAKRNLEHFRESQADHKKEWAVLMEKQEQDSKNIKDFIERRSPSRPIKSKARARLPFSLSIIVETRDFGQQEMQVTEVDDLKVAVEAFCEKFNMRSYEMALWVTVASAIKKKKKRLQQQEEAGGSP